MQHRLARNRHLQVCAALIAADCLVFTMVDPAESSAYWLIGGFLLFGATLFAVSGLIASALKAYGEQTHRRARRLGRYSAAIIMVLIGLQSIGQLTVKDVLTFLPLVVIAYLYFGYGKKVTADNP